MSLHEYPKAALIAERKRVFDALSKIEREETREAALPFVGNHYKTRNSFGGGDKGWWLYMKLVAYRDGAFDVWMFQTMSNGQFET